MLSICQSFISGEEACAINFYFWGVYYLCLIALIPLAIISFVQSTMKRISRVPAATIMLGVLFLYLLTTSIIYGVDIFFDLLPNILNAKIETTQFAYSCKTYKYPLLVMLFLSQVYFFFFAVSLLIFRLCHPQHKDK